MKKAAIFFALVLAPIFSHAIVPVGTKDDPIYFVSSSTPSSASRVDTYTAAASGVTVNTLAVPTKTYAIEVKGTGAAPTSWNVVLECSLDNVNFTTILTHSSVDGSIVASGATLTPCLYYRSRTTALVLGSATNIVVTILGMQ